MVTGAALCDPEGGLLEEAGRQESPATHATQPEQNAQALQNAREADTLNKPSGTLKKPSGTLKKHSGTSRRGRTSSARIPLGSTVSPTG